jgi:phosphatidylglycerophosphate synthase
MADAGAPPWDVRLARLLVRPLRHTPLTPNALTTAGLLASLGAAALMAAGGWGRAALGGALFMLAVLIDHMDGEFARLTGQTSRFGHYYDHVAAGLGYVSLFVGLGWGLRTGWLGGFAPIAGGLAAASIGIIFLIRVALEERGGRAMVRQGSWAGFEPEDGLYLVGPVAWAGLLAPFLVAAAIGAPLFLVWVAWCALTRRPATARCAPRGADRGADRPGVRPPETGRRVDAWRPPA